MRYFKTDFFPENLTIAFVIAYIFSIMQTGFLMANTCVYTVYLKRDQKNYIKLHCIEFEQVLTIGFNKQTLTKNLSFPFKISSVNVNKSAVVYRFGHIY